MGRRRGANSSGSSIPLAEARRLQEWALLRRREATKQTKQAAFGSIRSWPETVNTQGDESRSLPASSSIERKLSGAAMESQTGRQRSLVATAESSRSGAVPLEPLRRCHPARVAETRLAATAGRQVGRAATRQLPAALAGEIFQKGREISSSGRPGTPGSSP